MKNPDRDTVSRLDSLPNIGKSIATALRVIGVDHPKKLIGMEPFTMYEDLCAKTGKRQDPCVIDVFMSAVHFMEGGEPLPWWSFTQERKKYTSPMKSSLLDRRPEKRDDEGMKGIMVRSETGANQWSGKGRGSEIIQDSRLKKFLLMTGH